MDESDFYRQVGPLTFKHLALGQPKKTFEVQEQGEETDNIDEVISRHIRRVLFKSLGDFNNNLAVLIDFFKR